MIHKPHEAETLNLPAAAERLQKRADATVRVLWTGNVDASLQAVGDLRSNCDWLARELVRCQFSPMAKAKADLARILAAKAVRNG